MTDHATKSDLAKLKSRIGAILVQKKELNSRLDAVLEEFKRQAEQGRLQDEIHTLHIRDLRRELNTLTNHGPATA